jgi:hypothetical protein
VLIKKTKHLKQQTVHQSNLPPAYLQLITLLKLICVIFLLLPVSLKLILYEISDSHGVDDVAVCVSGL